MAWWPQPWPLPGRRRKAPSRAPRSIISKPHTTGPAGNRRALRITLPRPRNERRRPRKPRAPYRPHLLYRTPITLNTVLAVIGTRSAIPRGGLCRGSYRRRALAAFTLRRLEELRRRLRLVAMVEMEPVYGRSVADGLADRGGRYMQGAGRGRVAHEGLAGLQADDGAGFRMALPEEFHPSRSSPCRADRGNRQPGRYRTSSP